MTGAGLPGDPLLLEVHGDVCTDTVPLALAQLEPLLDEVSCLELDFTAVPLIDARCITMLAGLDRQLTQRGGSLRVRNPRPFVHQVLFVTNFDHLLRGVTG